jgi:hypothetical protein
MYYCSICGEELKPEEEDEGICENCKINKHNSLLGDDLESGEGF